MPLLFLLINSCASSTSFKEQVTGKWEWECAWGGFSGGSLTPASEGYTMTIVVKKDGSYLLYKNGKLIESLSYSFPYDKKNEMGYFFIKIGDMTYICKLEDNFLTMQPQFSDGCISFFKRPNSKGKKNADEYFDYFMKDQFETP
jgi:hypothetical protein